MENSDPGLFPDEPEGVPETHALRELFRTVTKRAFERFRALHDPDVEVHISDEVLSEFVHFDRIHRIRDRDGRRLTELSDMALEAISRGGDAGVERDLEIHQHAGDYALFMAGLFPESLEQRGRVGQKPLLACIGSTIVSLDQPRAYFIVEGRSAYSHVARLYDRLFPPRSHVFSRLSKRFEDYLDLMGCIRDELRKTQTSDSFPDQA